MLPGGFRLGQKLFFMGANQTLASGDRLTHGQQGEVVGHTILERCHALGMKFSENRQNVYCYIDELSESAPPPLPGGFTMGQELFYTGPSHTFDNGERLTHAQQGEVVGSATSEGDAEGLKMRFRGNKGFVTCFPEELSASAPPPLPGGYILGQALFYTGPSHTFGNGERLTHAQRGEVDRLQLVFRDQLGWRERVLQLAESRLFESGRAAGALSGAAATAGTVGRLGRFCRL